MQTSADVMAHSGAQAELRQQLAQLAAVLLGALGVALVMTVEAVRWPWTASVLGGTVVVCRAGGLGGHAAFCAGGELAVGAGQRRSAAC